MTSPTGRLDLVEDSELGEREVDHSDGDEQDNPADQRDQEAELHDRHRLDPLQAQQRPAGLRTALLRPVIRVAPGGRPAPGPVGRRTEADGALGGALGFGFGFGLVLVRPENEAPTLAARPRAPLAAPATAAIGASTVTEPARRSRLWRDGWVPAGKGGGVASACLPRPGPVRPTSDSAADRQAPQSPRRPRTWNPGVTALSELSSGVVLPEPSPDARDGASTRLSTPSSSAPFTDTRLSPSQLSSDSLESEPQLRLAIYDARGQPDRCSPQTTCRTALPVKARVPRT